MREMSAVQRAAAGRRWAAPVVCGVLAVGLAVVIVFAASYNALDFRIYMWGGHAVRHDSQLYLALAYGHWFTYSPFAAIVFVPAAALPLAVARVSWDLLSVAALAYSCVLVLKLGGWRPSRLQVAAVVAAAMALDPVWQTLFLGQINLILLALILTDVWRASRGRAAGIGVGMAAAIKLTPAIFIVFFLLARRTRAAFVAAATFAGCGLAGFWVAPAASKLYWRHLWVDTHRVGVPYISNQSPYAAAVRIAGGQGHIGAWWVIVSVVFAAIGLTVAAVLARRHDWLGATAVTGTTGLLVSPISWAHHWVWVLPALAVLVRDRHRAAAAAGYLLFAVAPFWYTPHSGGPDEYGFHWLLTSAANCFLIAGLLFLGYMTWSARDQRRGTPRAPGPVDEPVRSSAATLQREGAGDFQDAAGEVGGVGREQGRHHGGDVGGGAEAPQRDRLGQVRAGPFGQQRGGVAGARAGGHRVHADPEPAGVAGQGPDEPGDARAGQRAGRTRQVVVLAADRGHRDDAARPPVHHREHGGAAQVEHARQAGVDDHPPVGLVRPGQRLLPGDPGAAHHGLDRAEVLLGQPEPGGDLGGVGHVHVGAHRPGAEFQRGFLHLAGGRAVAVVAEADVPAVRGQPPHGGRADTP
jgi:Glycosyltransferase family 87